MGAAGVLAFLIVRSLWVRLPPRDGRPLTRADAPALFAMVEEVRRALRGPQVHAVLLTDDFNAAIVQLPRLGIFGWQKNYLIVGLPLLHALSPQQFRAVLAHEFGHLSGAHGGFGAWIYRVRHTWTQLLDRLADKGHRGAFLFTAFFGWYAPFFSAYSFVLARAQEYEADRSAAQAAGARTAADALIAVDLGAVFLNEQFWPTTYQAALHEATPPAAPFSAMRRSLRNGVPTDQGEQWLQRSLNMSSSSDDTHPSLAARLAALQEPPRVPPVPAVTAAEALLGEQLEPLQTELNVQWREAVAEHWRERYTAAQNDLRRLEALNAEAMEHQLSVEDALEQAQLTEELADEAASVPLYEAILARDEQCALALFRLGCLRLDRKDERGIELIERAMEEDQEAILSGCQAIYNFLVAQGRHERAQIYYTRGMNRAQVLNDADRERADVTWQDTLLPHQLSVEQLAQVVAHLARFPEIERAYLVCKQVQHLPDQPLYVLGLLAHNERRRDLSPEQQQALLERLSDTDIALPGLINAYIVNGRHTLHDKLKRVPGAQIFDRAGQGNK
jgi:Zn-dependent protease with chaperone function